MNVSWYHRWHRYRYYSHLHWSVFVVTLLIVFNTTLGSINSLGSIDFNSGRWYLGITVGADNEMTPRFRLGAAPYALNSERISGREETAFALLAGRPGGQTLIGGLGRGDDLTLRTTSNAKKGTYFLSDLTSNGFLKTSGGNGALTVDTNTYLTGNQTITLSGDVTGSGTTAITTVVGDDSHAHTGATLSGIDLAKNLNTFSSADLAGRLTDETGSGKVVLNTSPTFTGSIISPLVIGGATSTSALSLQTTSGVGASGADMHFLVGNNGATEAMTILNSGSVGIGTTAPGAKLDVKGNIASNGKILINQNTTEPTGWGDDLLHIVSSDGAANRLLFDTFAQSSGLTFRRANGTNASKSALLANDLIGLFAVSGYAATGYSSFVDASVRMSASENWTDTAHGTIIDFYTTKNGTTGSAIRMSIDNTGNVGIGTTSPNAAALLDVSSTTKGFLPPRMTTTQRDAIASPPAGLMIYNSTTNKLNFYNGTAWEAVTSA